MTKLSPAQELELSLAAAADDRYRDGKRALEPEVRREIRERSEYLLKARNDAALAAHESGIPKTQIALLGLHTSNTRTALEAIDEAARRRDALAAADPPRFAIGDGPREIVIALSGARLARACQRAGWTVDEAIRHGAETATFRVVDPPGSAGVAIVAQTPSFVDERGKLHPVVAWGRENADEALTWWKKFAA